MDQRALPMFPTLPMFPMLPTSPILPSKPPLDKYEQLVDNEKYSDVKLIIGDKVIHAHKCILSCNSKVFAAAFDQESIENVITIQDIDYDVLKDMLKFVYAGKTEGVVKRAKELLVAADKYDIGELVDLCHKRLCAALSIDNVIEYLILADQHNLTTLKNKAIEFIVLHGKHMEKKLDFNKMADFRKEVILDLFKAYNRHLAKYQQSAEEGQKLLMTNTLKRPNFDFMHTGLQKRAA